MSGLVNDDDASVVSGTLTCATNATRTSPVGAGYLVSGCSGLTAENYVITYHPQSLTVEPAPLTATVSGTQVYGGPASFAPEFSGFVNDDPASVVSGTLASATNATASSPVGGGYHVTGCSGLSAANYAVAFQDGGFAVTPADLTVTPDQQGMAFGTPVPTLTYTFTGLLNGDPATVVTGMASCSTTATSNSHPGSYPIACTAGTLAAHDYTFVFAPAMLAVDQAAQTITWTSAPPPSATVGSSFLVLASAPGGAVNVTVSGPCSIANGDVTLNALGTCVVTASQPGSSDYLAATPLVANTVMDPQLSQVISFPGLPSRPVFASSFLVTARSSSGLAVVYRVGIVCRVGLDRHHHRRRTLHGDRQSTWGRHVQPGPARIAIDYRGTRRPDGDLDHGAADGCSGGRCVVPSRGAVLIGFARGNHRHRVVHGRGWGGARHQGRRVHRHGQPARGPAHDLSFVVGVVAREQGRSDGDVCHRTVGVGPVRIVGNGGRRVDIRFESVALGVWALSADQERDEIKMTASGPARSVAPRPATPASTQRRHR